MYKLKKVFGTGTLMLALCGCEPEFQEGKVLKESGTILNIIESSGALFGNESLKFGDPTYILTVETAQGNYTINVREVRRKPIAALSEAIKVGDRIKFQTKFRAAYYFSSDRIGSVPSSEIELLGK